LLSTKFTARLLTSSECLISKMKGQQVFYYVKIEKNIF
jgi:hypothetical protein